MDISPDSRRIEQLERENRLLKQGMRQADRMRRLWEDALTELKRAKATLEQRNQQLSSLYRVASTIIRTRDIDQLLSELLDVMAEALPETGSGPVGVFLVEPDGAMRLAAERGGSEEFIAAHEGMRVGDCLCGRVAKEGAEAVLVNDCTSDPRCTLRHPAGEGQAHLTLSMHAKEQVVGVFFCYLPAGYRIEQAQLDTFSAIANQFGLAIQNARLFAEVQEQSIRDPLTGLGNRRLMEAQLAAGMENASRYQTALSIVMLDIDHFKAYNDTYGHPEGDKLLMQLAAILRNELRAADQAFRYGGEEFLVLLPHTDLAGAQVVAERIRKAVEAHTPVTVSLGVASYTDGDSLDGLVAAADNALYGAKRQGRNRVLCRLDELSAG